MPQIQACPDSSEGADNEEAKSGLLYLGVSFHLLGEYEEVERMYRQALKLKEKKKKMYFTPVGARRACGVQ